MDEMVPTYLGFEIVKLPTGWYRAVGHAEIPDCQSLEELHKIIDRYISRKNDPTAAPDVETDGPSVEP